MSLASDVNVKLKLLEVLSVYVQGQMFRENNFSNLNSLRLVQTMTSYVPSIWQTCIITLLYTSKCSLISFPRQTLYLETYEMERGLFLNRPFSLHLFSVFVHCLLLLSTN